MKSTARGSLAALLSCVAAATAAGPAVAGEQVPVSVPMEGVENVLGIRAPQISGGIPVPVPGVMDRPRYVQGRMLPANALPKVPLSSPLPEANLTAPLPRLLGGVSDQLGLSTGGGELKTETPGASLDAPLSAPQADQFGLPRLTLPVAALSAPLVQAAPGAELLVD
ncbi:hypothetical protein ACIQNU_15670 [Streptomyces sp. NPDC091292]|uniref:hypothetical protein n=1 Tax=Streptomyces sp. NPDC091292 TaxID=3365991 RepID=UPI00380B24E0